jgi:hypothetical protein
LKVLFEKLIAIIPISCTAEENEYAPAEVAISLLAPAEVATSLVLLFGECVLITIFTAVTF